MTPKQTRTAQIAQIVTCIADYYKVQASIVIGGMCDFVDELPKVTTTLEINAVSQPIGKTD